MMVRGLVGVGIDRIVSLVEEDEVRPGGDCAKRYTEKLVELCAEVGRPYHGTLCFPVRDFDVPDGTMMAEIVCAIESGLREGECIYVHCGGGRGRTGTVVGCVLITLGMATRANVLNVLRKLRLEAHLQDLAPETVEQREFVLRWRR